MEAHRWQKKKKKNDEGLYMMKMKILKCWLSESTLWDNKPFSHNFDLSWLFLFSWCITFHLLFLLLAEIGFHRILTLINFHMHADVPSHSSDMLTHIDTLTNTPWNLDSGLFSQKQCHFFLLSFSVSVKLTQTPCLLCFFTVQPSSLALLATSR